MKLIRLMTCDRLVEANIIKHRLNNEEIYCTLTNENFTNLLPQYNNMFGAGIQVMILESDYDKAKELLKDKLAPNMNDMICPHCESNDIGVGIRRNKGLKFLNALITILFIMPMGNVKPEYYCKACNKEID